MLPYVYGKFRVRKARKIESSHCIRYIAIPRFVHSRGGEAFNIKHGWQSLCYYIYNTYRIWK